MKIHKITMIVCDPNEDNNLNDIKVHIEQSNFITHFIAIKTINDPKEWKDNSKLNFGAKMAENYFNKLTI